MSKKNSAPVRRANKKKIWITVAVIVVLAIVAVSYFTSPAFQRTKTVGTIGNDTISETEFAYYYQTTFQNIYTQLQQTYGDYMSMVVDTSKSLDEQMFDETQTWHQYVTDRAVEGMQQIHALNASAKAEGFAIGEAEQANIAATTGAIESAAQNAGYTTGMYLRAMYGHGMDMKTYTRILTDVVTAEAYASSKQASLTYTDSQIDEYYNAHKEQFDTVDLRMVPIQGDEDANSGVVDLTDAQALAEQIMNLYKTEETLADFAVGISDDDEIASPDDTLYTYVQASSLSPEGMSEWCYDEARQYGDMATFSDESAYYVLFFIDRHDIDYNVVNMRHILVQPTQNEDGTVSDENAEAAIAETDSYLKEWEASDGTEETFAAMANQYSDDTGSNTNGGLYTDIYKGQMVRPVNDWLFDPERQIGDVTIVQSSFGYHLMYFAGTGANYKTTTVSAAMQTEDYEKWLADTTATAAVNLKENVGSVML